MSNHHLPYSDSDTEFLERQQALSSNPTYQLNNMTRVELARLRLLLDDANKPYLDEPEVTLTQSVIAFFLIVGYVLKDWAIPVIAIVSFCIGALIVGIAMVL